MAALRIIVRLLSITIFPSVGGYKVKIDGLENIQKSPAIYTFNHISLLDPLFAISQIPNAAVVVKGKYDSILAIWLLTRFFDFISTGDGSRGDIERAMEKISDAVGRGCNLIVFPEGTRMNGERLGDFKSMAFRLSRRTGIDIVPAAIVSSEPVFTRGTPLLPEKTGFAFHIKILPPLSPSDFNSAGFACRQKRLGLYRPSVKLCGYPKSLEFDAAFFLFFSNVVGKVGNYELPPAEGAVSHG